MKKAFFIVFIISFNLKSFAQQAKTKSQPASPKKPETTKKATQNIKITEPEALEEIVPTIIEQTIPTYKPEPDRIYNFSNSDLAVKWHQLMFDLVEQTNGFTPNVAARAFAYTNLAFYHSILPASNQYKSLSGQIQGFELPDSLNQKIDKNRFIAPVAANNAIFYMVDKLFYNAPFIWMEKVYALRDSVNQIFIQKDSLNKINYSIRYGEQIAKQVFMYSYNDGGHQAYLRSYDMRYKLPKCTSCFEINRVADLENTGPLHPNWGNNRAFVKNNSDDLGINPKVEFSIYRGSPFYNQVMEVYNTSKLVTPGSEKLQIANFWDDAATFSYTAAGHSVSILTQVLRAKPVSLERAAELYCKLGLGLNDAFIACWKSKYKHNLIRPIAFIKRYIDSKWEAALLTPPFPEFPSGHSVQSATMATILTSELGEKYGFTDFSKYFVGLPKTFNSFWEAANEASISRLYGGIHFRDALEQGKEMGKIVGNNILKIQFKKQ
ncbi:MAG: vanadium-dependent haloperoxidase [Spirosomaceae bacterium]|jgi:hypothetical protein|nr:vanadium-dependent haloperoxidase [Spirosomataceae bacterium]